MASGAFGQYVQYFGLAISAYVFVGIVYRLYFHPLSRYPGPLFGRITDWYSVYHAAIGDRHLDFYRLHQKYGTIVRFGPNRISANSVEGLRQIYGNQANTQKSSFYSVFDHFFDEPSTNTIIDKVKHARKRRILIQGLSESQLQDMEISMLNNYDRFKEILDVPQNGGWSKPIDMATWFTRLSFDIMGDICFGSSMQTMSSTENRELIDVMSDGAQGLNTVGHMPGLLKLGIEGMLMPSLIRGLNKFKQLSQALADRCMQEEHRSNVPCVVSSLQAKQAASDEQFSVTELVSETGLLIIAGSDTTSTAMTNTVFHLLNNRQAMLRLRAELDSTFNSVQEIVGGKNLSNCKYLRACVDESLRLSPPVGGLLAREVLPGGVAIDGNVFPAGTDIGVPTYALSHHENHFDEPFAYIPERWLAEEGTKGPRADSAAFCTFSIGPRGCLGKTMAYREITTIVARLVWSYDIRLVDDEPSSDDGDADSAAMKDKSIEKLRLRDHQTLDKFVGKVFGPTIKLRNRVRA